MSDETAAVTATPAAEMPKKKAKSAAKKPKTAPTHPKLTNMVIEAITSLKERGGSSHQAVKKHIASNHKVVMDRLTTFIRKYLKSAVASGALIQTKGKGASGSFKLSASGKKGKDTGKAAKAKKECASPKKAKLSAKKLRNPRQKAQRRRSPLQKNLQLKRHPRPSSRKRLSPPKQNP